MLKQLDRSDYPGETRFPERIVQFGGGNFLRGFADWVVDLLNEETDFAGGVALVKATPGDYADLDAQGCLYTTCLLGIRAGELVEQTRLVGAINRTVYPYQDLRRLSGAGAAAGDPLRLLQHHRVGHRLLR